MNEGRLPYNTYVRCTDKTLTCTAGGIARAGRDGGVNCMRTGEDTLCMSSAGAVSDRKELLELSFHRCVNELLGAGAKPQTLVMHGHIPQNMEEQHLRECIRLLDGLCTAQEMTLLPGTFNVSCKVDAPCFALSALGTQTVIRRIPQIGDTLLQVKGTGLSGTGLLLTLQREELLKHFSEAFLTQTRQKVLQPDIADIAGALGNCRVYLQPLAEGGVLAALWDLKSAGGLGFEVNLRALPMEQEVVEIAEVLGVNPYQLAGDGAVLLVTDEPEMAMEMLAASHIPAAVIGAVTAGPAGNIRKDDEISSISRPEPDELFRFL